VCACCVQVWDTFSLENLVTMSGHEGSVMCCAVNETATRVVSGGEDCAVRLWSLDDGKQLLAFQVRLWQAWDLQGGRRQAWGLNGACGRAALAGARAERVCTACQTLGICTWHLHSVSDTAQRVRHLARRCLGREGSHVDQAAWSVTRA
jgi:WD40 repeat protein